MVVLKGIILDSIYYSYKMHGVETEMRKGCHLENGPRCTMKMSEKQKNLSIWEGSQALMCVRLLTCRTTRELIGLLGRRFLEVRVEQQFLNSCWINYFDEKFIWIFRYLPILASFLWINSLNCGIANLFNLWYYDYILLISLIFLKCFIVYFSLTQYGEMTMQILQNFINFWLLTFVKSSKSSK